MWIYNILARFKALDVKRRDENAPLIRSMQVECSAKNKDKVRQFLEAYYNTHIMRTFMLGIKLRFIPLLHEAVGLIDIAMIASWPSNTGNQASISFTVWINRLAQVGIKNCPLFQHTTQRQRKILIR
jgi:hypothetical protein